MTNGQTSDERKGAAGGLSLDEFRTELPVFSGPLDLLLHLVKRNEVDVIEIPLASIIDQYLQVLRAMQVFDVNVAAEFLVMAATLMDIKSRALLPQMTFDDEEQEGPRDELVRQLLQYKRFREAADELARLRRRQALRFPRLPVLPEFEPQPVDAGKLLENVGIWDLVTVYAEIVRQIEMHQPAHFVYDEVPVGTYMDEIRHAMRAQSGGAAFLDLFAFDRSRPRMIGMFLALLELVRCCEAMLEQDDEDRTQMRIRPRPPGERPARREEDEPGAPAEGGAPDDPTGQGGA